MPNLDKKDRQILCELDRNSRQPLNQIARKVKLSRDTVAYRIRKLEEQKIIKKYITLIDFTKFDYQLVRLYLKLQNTTEQVEEEIAQHFLKEKNTITVYRVEGPFDIAVGFLVKNLQEYQKTYEGFQKKYQKHIASKDFSIMIDFHHYYRNFLVAKKSQDYNVISTGSFLPYKPDKKDLIILKEIAENSRISLLKLAKKVNMTAMGVKHKLRNLEKNKVIVNYRVLIDFKKLGYEYYKVDIEVEDLKIIPSLNQFSIQHPNIIYRNVTVGGRDFEVDGEFKNREEFYLFVKEIKNLFANKIRSYFYYRGLKIYKYSYFPQSLLNHN